jgi:hypothetical protein
MLDLSDDVLMLALRVVPERLADPAGWCHEPRSLSESAPKTSREAEELMDRLARLQEEAGR